jgi:hypothetical protein
MFYLLKQAATFSHYGKSFDFKKGTPFILLFRSDNEDLPLDRRLMMLTPFGSISWMQCLDQTFEEYFEEA